MVMHNLQQPHEESHNPPPILREPPRLKLIQSLCNIFWLSSPIQYAIVVQDAINFLLVLRIFGSFGASILRCYAVVVSWCGFGNRRLDHCIGVEVGWSCWQVK
jgi:hypothetical protein